MVQARTNIDILVRARTETRIFVRSACAGVLGGPDRGCEPGLGGRVGVSVLFGARAGSHVGGLLWPNAEPFTAEVDVLAVPRRSGGSAVPGGGSGEAAGGREASEALFAAMWTVRTGGDVLVGDSATHARALAAFCSLATAPLWARRGEGQEGGAQVLPLPPLWMMLRQCPEHTPLPGGILDGRVELGWRLQRQSR